MTTLRKQTRTAIDVLHSAGAQPQKMKTTDGYGLRNGARSIPLIDATGNKTLAGRYYEQHSGRTLPTGGFLQQTAQREGNTETIKLRDGKRGVTRRWDPAGGEFKFTALGKKYYSTLRRNYVVDVPIVVNGVRKNGTKYQIKSHTKLEKLGMKPIDVPLHLNHEQRQEYVKKEVQKTLKNRGSLFQVSDEEWSYDSHGSWGIHEETVGVDPETGEAEAHVILDRRVGAMPSISNNVLFQDAICPEAFEERTDNLCAPRQMAALLKLEIGEVCQQLTEVSEQLYGTEDWEDRGATPRMILEFCKKNGMGCAVVHNEAVVETLPGIGGAPTLAFAVHEAHCYFYKDVSVRKLLLRRQEAATAQLRRVQRPTKTPATSEWLVWGNEIAAGHFWAPDEDISSVRAWFLENGRNPKVIMKDECRIRTLIYNLRNKGGVCYVHALPECWGDLQRWVRKLDIGLEYRGENIPALSLKVLQVLVKRSRERTWLTSQEKEAVLEEYGHACAMCGSHGQLEFDHIARLSESYGEQVFQPLCAECHREKTTHESRMYDGDQLASHFELEVWKQYVESPRPPPLVTRLRQCDSAGAEIADVVRCRRSALVYNVHPLPVFCPLDDIQAREKCELGDVVFATKPVANRNQSTLLGYTGPGWIHRVQAEWLLHTNVIRWEDISHTLTATAHLPAGLLAGPLETMEKAWEDPVLAKLSVNALIGLWAIDEASVLKVRTSTREDDAPTGKCLTSTFHYQGGLVYDFMSRTALVSNTSCRPLHDLCMCTEAVRVGQMLLALKLASAIPCEIKTDSVLFRPKKRQRVDLTQLTYRDLDTLYSKGYPLARPPVQLTAICSETRPFRQAPATDKDLLRGEFAAPKRAGELLLRARSWRHCTPEQGEREVLDKRGLMVLGIAGTGKTHFCQGIVERLRAAGERVDIISKTHVASRRAGGVTADHWVRRYVINGSPRCSVLWVDEISQLDVGLLLQICKLAYSTDVRFILSGDFNQFTPIGNNFRGAAIADEALSRSNLLHTMASGNVVTLTECRRSDVELFSFYRSLVEGGSRETMSMRSVLAEARTTFNCAGFCPSNLTISHRKRIALNAEINAEVAPPDAVRLEVQGRTKGNSAQTMLIWPGIQLLGAVSTERHGVRNGCLYTVAAVGEDSVQIQELEPSRNTLTFDQVKAWLRLAYSQTYASVQGTEFTGRLRLHDVSHPFFTRRHLFVGLSRGRAAAEVSVRE